MDFDCNSVPGSDLSRSWNDGGVWISILRWLCESVDDFVDASLIEDLD